MRTIVTAIWIALSFCNAEDTDNYLEVIGRLVHHHHRESRIPYVHFWNVSLVHGEKVIGSAVVGDFTDFWLSGKLLSVQQLPRVKIRTYSDNPNRLVRDIEVVGGKEIGKNRKRKDLGIIDLGEDSYRS
ncbi:hypothetical protein AAVH_10412 [Aphelenchoides avenae]|nr:hypothetical protein AAVH_10412 [Aphelenchus avenae]